MLAISNQTVDVLRSSLKFTLGVALDDQSRGGSRYLHHK